MLRVDSALLEVDGLIDAVVAEILESPESLDYRAARSDFVADGELQEKIRDFQESSDFVAFRPEVRALQKEINLNPKVYAMKLAENALQEKLSALTLQLTRAVSESIVVDENLPLRGGNHHQHRRK